VIALIAFGLLILLTRPEAQTAGTSPSPTAASLPPLPSTSITVAPATAAATAAPTTAVPTTAGLTTAAPTTGTPSPRLTTPPSASP
jgi:hypothetical protein